MKAYVSLSLVVLALVGGSLAARAAGGPPPFLTRPILLHVGEDGLDHGHFVFSEEVAIPGPLAPNLGAADYNAASTSGNTSVILTSDADASGGSASYEGETSALSVGTLLVGASNHIYPGACNAAALAG